MSALGASESTVSMSSSASAVPLPVAPVALPTNFLGDLPPASVMP